MSNIVQDAILAAKAAVVGNDRETARDLLDRAVDEVLGETWSGLAGEEPTEESLQRIHGIRRIVGDVTVAVVEALRKREQLRCEESKPLDPMVVNVFASILRNQKVQVGQIRRIDAWQGNRLGEQSLASYSFHRLDYGDNSSAIRLWTGLRVDADGPVVVAHDSSVSITHSDTGQRTVHPLQPFFGRNYAPIWASVVPRGFLDVEIQNVGFLAEPNSRHRIYLYLTGWSYVP